MEKEKSIGKIDLGKINNPILKELIESKLITEEGLRIQGMGIVIRKLEALESRLDKTNLKIYNLTKDINRVMKHFHIETFQE